MAFSTGFMQGRGSSAVRGGGGSGPISTFARVVDVLTDSFHPKFDDYGGSQAINGVFYRSLSGAKKEEEDTQLRFAFCSDVNIKRVPLKNEIVEIVSLPSERRSTGPSSTKPYWRQVIPMWNHPHHNAYPDTIQFEDQESEAEFGDYFEETDKVNPLQLFPGDISIEGRHGQSIRMTGTKYDSNIWIDDSNNGQPLTIIRNGQKEAESGDESVLEDVNEDKSSIYLTSDHTVELTQANEKRDAWSEEPEKADKFKGSQVIINSGRLYFNAYDEHALLSAKEGIGLNAKTISLDGEEYVGLDAKKIYLGAAALQKEHEPVLKGKTSTDWLEDLTKQVESLANTLAKLPPAPPAAVAKLIASGNAILPLVKVLKNKLPQLHSKKVFTE